MSCFSHNNLKPNYVMSFSYFKIILYVIHSKVKFSSVKILPYLIFNLVGNLFEVIKLLYNTFIGGVKKSSSI